MLMTDLIARKKKGGALTQAEIAWWVDGYVAGRIPDYQTSALLMAVCFQGMSVGETVALTMAMALSGDVSDLSAISGIKVDKHSTGGVADTTTLIVAPVAAACGLKVAKMSGRGLGHTGGTIDKLESIPGFNASLSPELFAATVNSVGLAIIGQTGNLVPADKALYALRDVTSTVDSIPLIASSVMSKKIAAGADAIVLDVKTGGGAFMTSVDDAFTLARQMVDIGTGAGRKTMALVTDMDQPLGTAIGNSLEVWEAVEVLKGHVHGPLRDLSLQLAREMLVLAGLYTPDAALHAAEEALNSGRALGFLRRMIDAQEGDSRVLDDYTLLPQPTRKIPLLATRGGFITGFDTEAIGHAAMHLGAGRATKTDTLDYAAGLILRKRIGDPVYPGDPLTILHIGERSDLPTAERILHAAIRFGDSVPPPRPLIFGRVTAS